MNVVVLAGGTSTEREISIVTGAMVTKALRSLGYCAILVDVFCGIDEIDESDYFPEVYDTDAASAYMSSFNEKLHEMQGRRSFFGPNVLKLCTAADAVFMALHGSNGEDGKIQAAFELMGIRYTGSSYLGSAIAMDKELAKQMMRLAGIVTPRGIVLRKGEAVLDAAANGVGLPCVVKPACGGSSIGVSIAATQEEYLAAVEAGFRYEDVLIVETYIRGREFSVGVVDGEAYPIIEIAPIAGFYDYKNKYQAGSTVETCPADLPEETTRRMQAQAEAVCRALRITSYARVDIMMDEAGETYALEANTLPGMTPTSLLPQEAAALGIDFPHLCEKLIQVS